MTVRAICVTPGALLHAGEKVAELLEPSGRWVSLVATQTAGQVKAVRVRVGDQLSASTELAAIYVARRPRPDEDQLTGSVTRMSLEALQAEEFEHAVPVHRAPVHPLERPRHHIPQGHRPTTEASGITEFIAHHKLLISAILGAFVIAGGSITGASLYQKAMTQPDMSMDQLWSEMRASRIAAAEAQNAKPGDDLSTRAAAQNRALSASREASIQSGIQSGACAGFFIGMQLPGRHITKGVRRVTYLDERQGVGAYIWTKSLAPDTFSCADIKR